MNINFLEIEIEKMHIAGNKTKYMLSYLDKKFEINEQSKTSIENLKLAISTQKNLLIEDYLKRVPEAEKAFLISLNEKLIVQTPPTFIFKIPLIKETIVNKVAGFLKFFYKKNVAITALVIFLTLIFHHFLYYKSPESSIIDKNIWVILLISFIAYFSILIHEFGHASALKFFNKRCGEIGFGIYITIPALYTDVTQAWGLRRWQRVVVDLGGMYFQTLYLIPIMFYNLYNPMVEIHYIIIAILFSFIMNLNPLFKFDGYWILSDALGITNLRQKSNSVLSNLMKGKKSKELTDLTDLSPSYKTFIYVYMIASNLFFAYFILIVIPSNLFNIDYRSIAALITDEKGFTRYGLTQFIFLSLMCFILYRLVKPYFNKYFRKKKTY